MRALLSATLIESSASIKNLKRMKITAQTHNGFYSNPITFYICMYTDNTKKVDPFCVNFLSKRTQFCDVTGTKQ